MGNFIVTHQMLFTTINQMREETVFSKKKKNACYHSTGERASISHNINTCLRLHRFPSLHQNISYPPSPGQVGLFGPLS